ncbi:MAG: hypothetical protein ACOYMW_15330 [Candidatus Competibacteraceae bacterium]
MNLVAVGELVKLVNALINEYRKEIPERPKTMPVRWACIDMTVDEANLVIREFQDLQLRYQQSMNNTQTGGDITQLATGGAGLVAILTGIALLCFPPTAAAGAIVILSGVGTVGVGRAVGDGINKIGTNHGEQNIQQINTFIASIKDAIYWADNRNNPCL